MAKPKAPGLELDEDRAFQEKFWKAERAAWVLLFLIVAIVVAGFTGHGGPFARATIAGASATIDYPRVTRWESTDEIRILLARNPSDRAVVDLSSSFVDLFELEDIQPAPAESRATPGGLRLVFDRIPGGNGHEIVMHVRARSPSLATELGMAVDGGTGLRFRPIVLP